MTKTTDETTGDEFDNEVDDAREVSSEPVIDQVVSDGSATLVLRTVQFSRADESDPVKEFERIIAGGKPVRRG